MVPRRRAGWDSLPLLSEAEQAQLWTNGTRRGTGTRRIARTGASNGRRHDAPDATALVFGDESVSMAS